MKTPNNTNKNNNDNNNHNTNNKNRNKKKKNIKIDLESLCLLLNLTLSTQQSAADRKVRAHIENTTLYKVLRKMPKADFGGFGVGSGV